MTAAHMPHPHRVADAVAALFDAWGHGLLDRLDPDMAATLMACRADATRRQRQASARQQARHGASQDGALPACPTGKPSDVAATANRVRDCPPLSAPVAGRIIKMDGLMEGGRARALPAPPPEGSEEAAAPQQAGGAPGFVAPQPPPGKAATDPLWHALRQQATKYRLPAPTPGVASLFRAALREYGTEPEAVPEAAWADAIAVALDRATTDHRVRRPWQYAAVMAAEVLMRRRALPEAPEPLWTPAMRELPAKAQEPRPQANATRRESRQEARAKNAAEARRRLAKNLWNLLDNPPKGFRYRDFLNDFGSALTPKEIAYVQECIARHGAVHGYPDGTDPWAWTGPVPGQAARAA